MTPVRIYLLAALVLVTQVPTIALVHGYARTVQAEDDCADNTYAVTRIAGQLFCIGEPR